MTWEPPSNASYTQALSRWWPQKSSENLCVQPKVKGLNHSNMDAAATYNHDWLYLASKTLSGGNELSLTSVHTQQHCMVEVSWRAYWNGDGYFWVPTLHQFLYRCPPSYGSVHVGALAHQPIGLTQPVWVWMIWIRKTPESWQCPRLAMSQNPGTLIAG